MKITLIDEWKEAWKWLSVNCMVLAGAIQGAWIYIPDDLRNQVPQNIVHILTIALLLLGLVGRLTKSGDDDARAS